MAGYTTDKGETFAWADDKLDNKEQILQMELAAFVHQSTYLID